MARLKPKTDYWNRSVWIKFTHSEADTLVSHILFASMEHEEQYRKYKKKNLMGIAWSEKAESQVLMSAREKIRQRLFGREKWFKEQKKEEKVKTWEQ